MYTAVLMAALTTTTAAPNWGWGRPWQSCACYNGYPSSYNPGCYCGYGYGGYGFAGGGAGYHGGCYGGYGYGAGYGYGYAIPYGVGCYGCYGGYSCYGIPLPGTTTRQPSFGPSGSVAPAPNPYPAVNPAPKTNPGGTEEIVPAPPEKKKTSLDPTKPMRARLAIEIPEGGKLFVDDQLIETKAGTRSFQTPLLARGERYFYDIRIESAGETHRQRVIIEAGRDVAVAFPQRAPTATVRR